MPSKNEDSKENKGEDQKKLPIERRGFIKMMGGALGVAATAQLTTRVERVGAAVTPSATGQLPDMNPIASASGEYDVLVRMQEELRLAMKKPVEERKWAMVINLRKCVGCHACTIACVSENKLPSGVVYRWVMDEESGTYPNVARRFIPRPCMHCDNPPCTKVCPVGATYKQVDGTVVIDYNRCIGCRFCIVSCPYTARVMDYGDEYYEDTPEAEGLIVGQEQAEACVEAPNFEYTTKRNRTEKRNSPVGNARKCHFCLHRLENGMLPACVTTCIGRVNYFGDLNNPDSMVSEMVAQPGITRIKEEAGTEPSVYYLF